MRKILLVDDELKSLESLQRVLGPQHLEWEIGVVQSGTAALEQLQAHAFDILIADIHKPGSNDAPLLAEVREQYPQVVRIALSGHSEQELTLQAVGLAHQYLAKPCAPDILKETLQRVCAQRDLLTNEALKRLVAQLPSLPVLPDLYMELTQELETEEPSLERIGQIIARDVAMTAKLLQLVNSAFFGLKRQLTSPKEAAFFLGTETLRSLVLSLQVFSAYQAHPKLQVTPEALWTHSLQVGQLAKMIAKAEQQPPKIVEAAFTAGLLHEIGILILAFKLPQPYAVAEGMRQQKGDSLVAAERRVFRVAHPEVGAYLLGLWGLPDALVEAVAFSHEPSRCPVPHFTPLTAVHVADHLLETKPGAEQSQRENNSLDEEYLARLGLNDRLPFWQENLALHA
jgi:HD-like signal output (HDOD) protein/CheY-like chemotaxis protein